MMRLLLLLIPILFAFPTSSDIATTLSYSHPVDAYEKFRPIRIRVHLGVTTGLNQTHLNTLDTVVTEAIKRVSSALNVNRVRGRLRLSRPGGCLRVHTSGSNMDKCAVMVPGYSGDYCLDGFRIPDKHQVGLKIYKSHDNPIPDKVIYEDGRGLEETDVVLYVQATSTATCVNDKVVAYARYCQKDQYQRPIAGYVNFCPEEFLASVRGSDIQYAVKTATHELIHLLGFSDDWFSLFKSCKPGTCPPKKVSNIEQPFGASLQLLWVPSFWGRPSLQHR